MKWDDPVCKTQLGNPEVQINVGYGLRWSKVAPTPTFYANEQVNKQPPVTFGQLVSELLDAPVVISDNPSMNTVYKGSLMDLVFLRLRSIGIAGDR
jgi:hypothetical protein